MFGPSKIQEHTAAFFNSLLERRFSDAENILSSIELGIVFYKIYLDSKSRGKTSKRMEGNQDYLIGYIKALEGMLTAARLGDDRTFINRSAPDAETLERYRRYFNAFVRNEVLHPLFDRGFFSGWLDFTVHQKKLLEAKNAG
jgi:hypothetical protein